jgi:hypothetical protein
MVLGSVFHYPTIRVITSHFDMYRVKNQLYSSRPLFTKIVSLFPERKRKEGREGGSEGGREGGVKKGGREEGRKKGRKERRKEKRKEGTSAESETFRSIHLKRQKLPQLVLCFEL